MVGEFLVPIGTINLVNAQQNFETAEGSGVYDMYWHIVSESPTEGVYFVYATEEDFLNLGASEDVALHVVRLTLQ